MGNIGIIGRARVGKDAAGKWLVDERGYRRVAFADALKLAAWKIDPYIYSDFGYLRRLSDRVTGEASYERAKDEYPEVRRILQELGSAMRDVDPDIWIRPVLEKTRDANESGVPVVITDVRYPNEAATLKRAGFHLVYIERPGIPQLDHESEGALTAEDADYHIVNDGSVDYLRLTVETVADRIYDIESRRHLARL